MLRVVARAGAGRPGQASAARPPLVGLERAGEGSPSGSARVEVGLCTGSCYDGKEEGVRGCRGRKGDKGHLRYSRSSGEPPSPSAQVGKMVTTAL